MTLSMKFQAAKLLQIQFQIRNHKQDEEEFNWNEQFLEYQMFQWGLISNFTIKIMEWSHNAELSTSSLNFNEEHIKHSKSIEMGVFFIFRQKGFHKGKVKWCHWWIFSGTQGKIKQQSYETNQGYGCKYNEAYWRNRYSISLSSSNSSAMS